MTVTDADPVCPPADARMDAEPGATPLTVADVPLPDTVATPDELLDHVTFARSAAVPPVTWAVSVAVPPTANCDVEGETVTATGVDGSVGMLFTVLPSGSGGHAVKVNMENATSPWKSTRRTDIAPLLSAESRCCSTETHGEAAGSHRTVIVSPGSAGVWTGSRRACVACSKL